MRISSVCFHSYLCVPMCLCLHVYLCAPASLRVCVCARALVFLESIFTSTLPFAQSTPGAQEGKSERVGERFQKEDIDRDPDTRTHCFSSPFPFHPNT